MLRHVASFFCAITVVSAATADTVNITEDRASTEISVNGDTIVIARNQDTGARIRDDYAKTSRECPPFCISPMAVNDGVETLGELELITFMETHVADGNGLLIDARLPGWFEKGTIPGAVEIPFTTLDAGNPYRDQILQALGAVDREGTLDFSDAPHLALFCNGPWDDQSPRAIRNLIDAGYPAEKLHYYRGGLQLWLLLGLTVELPQSQG